MINSELKNEFIETECLFCRKKDDIVVYPPRFDHDTFNSYAFSARRKRKRVHYQLVQCKGCKLVRSNPILNKAAINRFYADSEFIFSEEAPYAAKTYALLLQRLIIKYALNVQSLLEIGCSTGFFLEMALACGINDVLGFEPSTHCYQCASDAVKKLIVNDVYNPELLTGKKFDVACSFHVFDHLTNPDKVLSSIMENLSPDGHVLLVCHDVESWSAKILKDHSPIYDIEHVYLFSRATITKLLEQSGYSVLESGSLLNTYPLAYWLRMMPFVQNVFGILPNSILKLPVSIHAGNLYVFARKRG